MPKRDRISFVDRGYAVKTKVYGHRGAKCRKCGRIIPYGAETIWVRKGAGAKFYHPACYKSLKRAN